ncbi:MAG TPA: CehA/McbA family metallohydrolase [Planctomycetota bacterium]|nr:CehA/McbA family metallohydrolase [Planctomycetota bacterium]
MTRIAAVLTLAPLLGFAGDAEELRKEWARIEAFNYEELEQAPVRGWGSDALQEPLRRIHRAVREQAGPKPEALAASGLEAYDAILDALKLKPICTLAPGEQGASVVDNVKPQVVLHRGVPSALVLRVLPSPRGGRLSIAPVEAEGIRIEGQELDLPRHFAAIVVLPAMASGEPVEHSLALKVACAGKASEVPLRVGVAPAATLKGSIVRKSDGTPLAAKLYVEDGKGRLYVVPGEANYRTQSWYAFLQPRYSYADGQFTIPLPPGWCRVTAMKGYGHKNWQKGLEAKADEPTECKVELEPLCPVEEDGWLAADMHLHGKTTLAMLRAEDVNVAMNCHYSSHQPRELPLYRESSDATHLACSGQEIEHWNFGNVFYFGIPTTVLDPKTPTPELTPFFHYDEQCHKMGGVTIRYLRARPFAPKGGGQQQPELAVSAALGLMDLWSVLDNSMQNLLDDPKAKWSGDGWDGQPLYEHTYKTWYALLNCGLRVPASGGTSWQRLSRIGFNRVYARCPEPLSVKAFAAALKRGDGFVTNGPLLWLKVNGRLPGDGLALDAPAEVKVSLELASRHPVGLVQILCNGEVAAERKLEKFDGRLSWEKAFRVDAPCWFAARCFGTTKPRYPHSASHNQFAHTSPLVVTVGGKRPASGRDAARFVAEIDALVEFAPSIPTPDLRARALEAYANARQFFANQMEAPR